MASRLRRRLRTVPLHVVLFLVVTALAPLWLVAGLLIDGVRRLGWSRPAMALRLFTFGWWYLLLGVTGLSALLWHWLISGFGRDLEGLRERTFRLQVWWASSVYGAIVRIFRLRVEVEGEEALTPGPFILLMRHASIVDTMLPSALVSRPTGVRLRYVLKRELLADPVLDIAGNRLVNHFVDREGDSVTEVRAVASLADGLGPDEGVLIYPEGTRFTEERRTRVLGALGDRDSHLAERARRLHRVLPPRPGGTTALLESGHDVVIGAHTGLEPLATIPDAWSGRIVGATVRVAFRRFPGSTIPSTRRGRIDWLFDRWEEVDAWVSSA